MARADTSQTSRLFTPITLRGVTARNRVVVAPMCVFMAEDGVVNDWHTAHYMKLAQGGVGMCIVEATAVEPAGRITPACAGLWSDDQIEPMSHVVRVLEDNGTVAGIQIAHAGRKAATRLPWEGGQPLDGTDAAKGEPPWEVIGPSAVPMEPDWPTPREMTSDDITRQVEAWGQAARRAREAGFRVCEIHGAHGYLVHEFLSPLSNFRTDAYGGDLTGRMRFALEVSEAVRAEWSDEAPVFFRLSCIDEFEGGWTIEDSVGLAKGLKVAGVDVIDCSAGGIRGPIISLGARVRPPAGFQVPFAEQIGRDAGIMTMAGGMIVDPHHAEEILSEGRADLITLARELLNDPNWPAHAAQALGADPEFRLWPDPYRWPLKSRAAMVDPEPDGT